MRTALYIRVSTEEQAEEGYSIAAQKDRLTSFCHSQGWDIADIYIEDGKSAKDMERPELQRLLNDAQEHKFEIVLVYKLDRLTRSVMDLYSLLKKFEQSNVKFKSATEVYDTTTAMGRLFITLVAALAQWERENLAERVRFGMEQMVMEGKRPGGPIPYGYDKNEKVIPEEKATLGEIRRLYMDGQGFHTIAKQMNQSGKLKRGAVWSTYSCWYVLDNPYYAGLIRWGTKNAKGKYVSRKKEEQMECILQEGDHEPIFSREEYEEHKDEMKRRSFNGHSKKKEYWFSGVLRCGKCGHAMSGRYTKKTLKDGTERITIYYICANKQEAKGCTMPLFRQVLVEKLIMEHIQSIKLDQERLNNLAGKSANEKDQWQLDLEELNKQLNKIKDRKKKWQYAYAEDLISDEELRERNAEEREKEESIRSQIDEIKTKLNAEDSLQDSINLMIELPDIWQNADDKERNQIIRTIFQKIEVDTPVEKAVARKGKFMPATITNIEFN